MKQSYSLKIANAPIVPISKDYFTVGVGVGYDLSISQSDQPQILFVLNRKEDQLSLTPGEVAIEVNGKRINNSVVLHSCDRISWQGNVAILLDGSEAIESMQKPIDPMELFSQLSSSPQPHETLELLLRYSGAEYGSLLCEGENGAEWMLLADKSHGSSSSVSSVQENRRALVSHTVLAEAIRSKRPVYIESIIGHQWEGESSILQAQFFSVACLPLLNREKESFGALFLYTRTPGKSIQRASLESLQTIATQMALLHSTQHQLQQAKQRIGLPIQISDLVFDKTAVGSAMAQVSERIGKLAPHEISILIRGETGTGKELIARQVHTRSGRANGPFVAINCAAIPPSLIESILFGYTKGAFTGAVKDKAGKFVQANGGTLFLDEIGDLPAELQTKLLRVLQEREVEPIGADKAQSIDIRILSATHQDLESLVSKGTFRSDLYYRLNGATIQVPNLRERGKRELMLLANHFLGICGMGKKLSGGAEVALQQHFWSGNVRELQQVILRAIALSSGEVIEAKDLELTAQSKSDCQPSTVKVGSEPIQSGQSGLSLKESQERHTQELIQQALERSAGNRAKAAAQLGISERTLYRLLGNGTEPANTPHQN